MHTPEPTSPPAPLSRRDADFLLAAFRGFRAIAAQEARTFLPTQEAASPAIETDAAARHR